MSDHVLHLGDCLGPEGLASLPDKSVDHVICDPPYEAEAHERQSVARAKQGMGRSGTNSAAALPFGAITDDVRGRVAAEMARVTRRWVFAFCQIEAVGEWRRTLVQAGLVYVRGDVWVKPDGLPQLSGDRPAQGCEAYVLAHAPLAPGQRYVWNGGGKSGVYTCNKNDPEPSGHPTQKPTRLMSEIVADLTDPGDLVLDPFAGSGTTGVACKRLGRRFLGWERDEKYWRIARKRIEAAREQLGLFSGARAPKPKQASLLESP